MRQNLSKIDLIEEKLMSCLDKNAIETPKRKLLDISIYDIIVLGNLK